MVSLVFFILDNIDANSFLQSFRIDQVFDRVNPITCFQEKRHVKNSCCQIEAIFPKCYPDTPATRLDWIANMLSTWTDIYAIGAWLGSVFGFVAVFTCCLQRPA